MAPRRAVQLSLKKPTYAVCVVGTETLVNVHRDVPRGAKTFRVSGSSKVEVSMVYDPRWVTEPTDKAYWPLDTNVDVVVSVDTASKDLNDLKVEVSYFKQQEEDPLGHSRLYLTALDVALDVDASRMGKVKRRRGDKKTWRWGPEGHGAILLVNCDKDSRESQKPDLHSSQPVSLDDLQDMSPVVLTCDGPDELFDRHKLVLSVSPSDSRRLRVFHARGGTSISDYRQVLGPGHLSHRVERQPGEQELRFCAEGLAFPDADFSGLVSLSVSLVDTMTRWPSMWRPGS